MDIIEAYYMVAADIRERATAMLEQAKNLAAVADRMKELRLPEEEPPDTSSGEPHV